MARRSDASPVGDRRLVLVTGASRGIGRAIATRLSADGHEVIAHFNSSLSFAPKISGATPATHLVQADLAASSGIDSLAQQVRAICGGDRLAGVIHNAAIATRRSFETTLRSELENMLAVNVIAPFILTQAVLPQLAEGSRVIFISSVAARKAFPDLPAYAMTKAAVEALTIQLAASLGEQGVRVTAIAPGAVNTDMNPRLRDPGAADLVTKAQALKRIAQPDDIADAVAMLMSKDARWVTGAVLPVSGGLGL